MQVRRGLLVDRDHVGPGAGESLDVEIRPLDHQMDIQEQTAQPVDCLHDQGTDRQVGNEVPVHHVQVEQSRPARLGRGDLVGQATEIGRKDRGGESRGGRQARGGPRRVRLLLGQPSHRPGSRRRR